MSTSYFSLHCQEFDEFIQDVHDTDDHVADTPPQLPPGITVDHAISDFLAKLAHLALTHVQATYGSHITMREVQWCLTVPSIWDDSAKRKMAQCAELAGMVTGAHCPAHLVDSASPHPLEMVPESEAAALFCAREAAAATSGALRKGDQFVVADVGGGTVDIAVYSLENDEGTQVAEVAMSSTGGLCGGTFVDRNFVAYLARRVPCFRDYVARNPAGMRIVMRRWEEIKSRFDGSDGWGSRMLELPARLAAAWKSFDHGNIDGDKKEGAGYDKIEITCGDMAAIFDPVVDKVVQLIKAQVTTSVRALMLVGGFSASPYLVKRVREEIGEQGLVESVIAPPDPGSAICRGAVMFGLRPDTAVARISRKTYGIETYQVQAPLSERRGICIHVRRGDVVRMNHFVALTYSPVHKYQKSIEVRVYSSDQPNPGFGFTSKHGSKPRLEGKFVLDISDDPHKLGLHRTVKHTMEFRRSGIHVYSQRENFGDTAEVVRLNHTVPFNAH